MFLVVFIVVPNAKNRWPQNSYYTNRVLLEKAAVAFLSKFSNIEVSAVNDTDDMSKITEIVQNKGGLVKVLFFCYLKSGTIFFLNF